MMSPSSLAVFALKFLQKSMMLTPCGPSAVPTGGAGVALPPGIWSFTIAWTFFATLNLLHLQEIEFHRRRAAEDRHHDLQRVAIEVDLVHHAVEAGEGTLIDSHVIALLERVFRLGLLGRRFHLLEDVIDLFLAQRRRLGAGAQEARHLLRVLPPV